MNKKRNLLLTILVFTAVFLINKLTGDIFNGIADIHVSEFLCEFKSAALAIMGAVILKKMWIYQRFDTDLLKKSWATGLFDVILSIYSYLNYYAGTRQGITAKPVELLVFILTMICVGIYEETMFRGLLQNGFHEFFGEDTVEHVILSVIFAGVCFGALHLTNAFRPGVSLSDAVPQAIAACGAGIFYGAVYFRTGKNLWYNGSTYKYLVLRCDL